MDRYKEGEGEAETSFGEFAVRMERSATQIHVLESGSRGTLEKKERLCVF